MLAKTTTRKASKYQVSRIHKGNDSSNSETTTTMITVVTFLDHPPFRKHRVFCNLQCNTEQEEKAEMLQCNNPPPP